MRLKSDLSEQAIAEGLVPQHDLFRKKQLALSLTALFENLEHGSVCLLDGRWGTGKTTFVRQWCSELKSMNIPSIYFDAFASDYLESPFEAIAGTFVQAALEAGRSKQEAYKSFLSKAAAVGKAVASVSAKVGIKAATLGAVNAVDLEGLGEIKGVLADGLGQFTEESIKKLLESHADRHAQFNAMRKSLADLPNLLRPDQSDAKPVPLIVFIDELDRCRPDFSLGILEVLKHFFRADGIHFVLVTNREHLQTSVDRRYGAGVASAEYLEKFYDFVVYFEHSYERHSEHSVETFINAVMQNIITGQSEDGRHLREYVRDIALAFRLTLRQIQSLSTNVAIAYLAARPREYRPAFLIAFLALIKTMRPDLYKDAKRAKLKWEDVRDFLTSVSWGRTDIDKVISVFRYHLDANVDVNAVEWRGYGESLWNYNLERERVIPYLVDHVLDRFAAPADAA